MQRYLINKFLVTLTLVGLLLAPISQTMAISSMSMHVETASVTKMDCCPSGQSKAASRAKACPFRALCMTVWTGLLASDAASHDFRGAVAFQLHKVGAFEPARPHSDLPSPPPRA